MTEQPDIRVATRSDVAVLADLIAAFRDHLQTTSPTTGELIAFLPEALDDPALDFCLAFSADGTPLGYAQTRFYRSVWETGLEAYLEDLYVTVAARRSGVGRVLLDFALNRARTQGAHSIGLSTNERNDPAQAFYRRMGFLPVTQERWGDGREIRWSRSLA